MLFSVIVPTRHRPELLQHCLSNLAPHRQSIDTRDYEVIVTDDGQPDTAQQSVRNTYSWARWTAGPGRGPAANRNHGARQASGQWLVFVDDDCLPDRDWLQAIAQTIQQHDPDVVEGKTVCPDKRDDPFQEHVENLQGNQFWSCNLAVRRAAFAELGGFDEDFTEPGGEDLEFGWRIRERRLSCRFVPAALVVHPPRQINWSKIWWRTLLMRWMLLYRIKTNQSAPLNTHPLAVSWQVIRKQSIELARTTSHLLTRFEPDNWRTRLFFQGWKLLSFPVVLPYLIVWEFRFRQRLTEKQLQSSMPQA